VPVVRRFNVRISSLVIAIGMLGALGLMACEEHTATGPTNQEFAQARQQKAQQDAKGSNAPKPPAARAPAAAPEPVPNDFAGVSGGETYVAKGKRDPFRSFEWEQLKLAMMDDETRGPLEQFDIGQLAVVGVIWSEHNARALVQDPSGMSYIVAEGARIGKNDGRIIRIDDNLVVVKEKYVDSLGEETTNDIEMRIRTTEGG
jgi:Tfp pilus assembly protein PilP